MAIYKPHYQILHVQWITFLAHLSRRWACSIPMVRRPSIVVIHTFKLEYLWSELANLDHILCVVSLGWGKGCIRFWADWIKTLVSMATDCPHWLIMGKTMSPPFLGYFWSDPFLLAGNEDMHKILDEFEFRPDQTTDYRVSCPWASKNFPVDL